MVLCGGVVVLQLFQQQATSQGDTMNKLTTAQALRSIASTTDTALAELWWQQAKAEDRIASYRKVQADVEKRNRPFRLLPELQEAEAKLEALKAEAAPLEAIATAGKWSRFVLVPNGHLHRGFGCSTLRWTTRTGLMPEFSGADEAEVVELAGERACTVCFPSAPVNRPSMLPIHVKEREEREAEAAAKQAAKAKQAAEKIVVGRTVYKTLRAAENAMSYSMDNVVYRSYMEGVDAEHTQHLRNLAAGDRKELMAIVEATKAVYPDWDEAGVLTKKFAAKAKEYRKAGFNIPADAKF